MHKVQRANYLALISRENREFNRLNLRGGRLSGDSL